MTLTNSRQLLLIGTTADVAARDAGVQMFRVSADGMLLDRPPRVSVMPTTRFPNTPAFASSGGGELLMVRNDTTPGYVRGQRIDGSLSPQGREITVSGQVHTQSPPTLVRDGTGALVLWTDFRRSTRQHYLLPPGLSRLVPGPPPGPRNPLRQALVHHVLKRSF